MAIPNAPNPALLADVSALLRSQSSTSNNEDAKKFLQSLQTGDLQSPGFSNLCNAAVGALSASASEGYQPMLADLRQLLDNALEFSNVLRQDPYDEVQVKLEQLEKVREAQTLELSHLVEETASDREIAELEEKRAELERQRILVEAQLAQAKVRHQERYRQLGEKKTAFQILQAEINETAREVVRSRKERREKEAKLRICLEEIKDLVSFL